MIKHHLPKKLPITGLAKHLDYNKFSRNLDRAQYSLGVLEGSQRKLQNPSLLISPLTTKEAATSSKIEGTQSTASDVFVYEAGGPGKEDTKQVVNYRKALLVAQKELRKGRPLSSHLIESLHGVLLQGVRRKGPIGKFRTDKVWIGKRDKDPIEKALYVPMKPEKVPEYMQNLVNYVQKSDDNILIKTGVFHYQFEAIHPFNDGNGRMGRMLIPLLLVRQNKLSLPILYISGYLEKHRSKYISQLHKVDVTGNYESWLEFYFQAISHQLKETQDLVDKIYGLYDLIREKFKPSKSPYLIPFIDYIFKSPGFTIPDLQKKLKISAWNTASTLITSFIKEGLITDTKVRDGHAKIYIFTPLLKLLQ